MNAVITKSYSTIFFHVKAGDVVKVIGERYLDYVVENKDREHGCVPRSYVTVIENTKTEVNAQI